MKYLFLLSLHNSGSSVFRHLFSLCRNIVTLSVYEGHQIWDSPSPYKIGNCRVTSRNESIFRDKTRYNFPAIKKSMLENWSKQKKDQQDPVYFDKSPTTAIYVAEDISAIFGGVRFINLIRNPYAVVEGIMRRERDATVVIQARTCAQHWNNLVREQIRLHERIWSLLFTYEVFCDYPDYISDVIRDFVPECDDFAVGDLPYIHSIDKCDSRLIRSLYNFNTEQIKALSVQQIDEISAELDPAVMKYLEYDYM